MKLLLLSPYPPYPPRSGGALRIYNLLRGLAERHEVWCLTFAPNDAAVQALEPLRALCRVVTVRGPLQRSLARRAGTTLASPLPDMALRNAAPAFAAALDQLLAANQFAVLQAASIEMARYPLQAHYPGHKPLLVLDEFNAEYLLQKRTALTDLRNLLARSSNPKSKIQNLKLVLGVPYSLVQWRKLARYERELLRRYDRVLAVSHEDAAALLRLEPQAQISIVPNGVDTDFFAPAEPIVHRPSSIVFTGTLDFRPNVDALRWFVREVLPRVRVRHPETTLQIVGKSPGAAVRSLEGAAVRVHGDVPDVRPYIAAAAAYVVPMRMGGGVRLKLLEALAMQAAVVSTGLGAEGVEGIVSGRHLLLADDAAGFAQAIVRLLEDRALAERLGAAGRELVRARYDWRVIAPALEASLTARATL